MMCLFSLEFCSCTRIKRNHIIVHVLKLTKTFMYFSSIDQHISFMAMLSHFFYCFFYDCFQSFSSFHNLHQFFHMKINRHLKFLYLEICRVEFLDASHIAITIRLCTYFILFAILSNFQNISNSCFYASFNQKTLFKKSSL